MEDRTDNRQVSHAALQADQVGLELEPQFWEHVLPHGVAPPLQAVDFGLRCHPFGVSLGLGGRATELSVHALERNVDPSADVPALFFDERPVVFGGGAGFGDRRQVVKVDDTMRVSIWIWGSGLGQGGCGARSRDERCPTCAEAPPCPSLCRVCRE